MTAGWRAVPLADAAAGWTAVAGGTDTGWLFAPGGRWAAVTGSDSAPLLGTVPMRTALGAAVFDSPAGDESGLRCVAAVSGARTQDDRAALCLFATDRGRFGVADDIVAKIIDVPTDGPVAHWPVLGGGGSAGPVVTAWADGDETVTLRSTVVDPSRHTIDTPTRAHLPERPWRLQAGWAAGTVVVLVTDSRGTRLLSAAGDPIPVARASGASHLTDGLVVTPSTSGLIDVVDIASASRRRLEPAAPPDGGVLRSASIVRAGTARFLVWETAVPPEGGFATATGWLAPLGTAGGIGPASRLPGGPGLVAGIGDRLVVAPADAPSIVFVGLPG